MLNCNYSEILNSTVGNNKQNIEGLFYFDCVLKSWFMVTSAEAVFTEINYAFGHKWPMLRHSITGKKAATEKQVEKLMNCHRSEFVNLIV